MYVRLKLELLVYSVVFYIILDVVVILVRKDRLLKMNIILSRGIIDLSIIFYKFNSKCI